MGSTLIVDEIQGATAATKVKMPAGTILQTLSSDKLTAQGINTDTFTDLSDLSVTITPHFNTSKILITAHVYVSWTDAGVLRLMRGSTRIPNNTEGNAADRRGFAMTRHEQGNEGNTYSVTHLDSPATTSATTCLLYTSPSPRDRG